MILVTGGTGFIGSHLVERLAAQGRAVRCLVRPTSGLRDLPQTGIQVVRGDLESGAGLADALRGVDTVIHLAGVTKARAPIDYDRGNAAATAQLVRAAGSGGLRRFVHVSSLAAAGPSSGQCAADRGRRTASRLAVRPLEARGRAIRASVAVGR